MTIIFNYPKELISAVGQHLGYSNWLIMDQERVNRFADATDDHQWIHVDQERAKKGPFGACIAHGYLSLSLVNKFMPEVLQVKNSAMGVNYGCDRVRFPSPVTVGMKIRGGCELISANEIKGGVQVMVRVTIEIENSQRPACVIDTISRYYSE